MLFTINAFCLHIAFSVSLHYMHEIESFSKERHHQQRLVLQQLRFIQKYSHRNDCDSNSSPKTTHGMRAKSQRTTKQVQSPESAARLQGALRELLSRDSFYATEMEVFAAVARWTAANGETAAALALVRLPLLSVAELLTEVRPRGLASPDALLDAIQLRTTCPDSQLPYRGSLGERNLPFKSATLCDNTRKKTHASTEQT
jgi:hypothetical protein